MATTKAFELGDLGINLTVDSSGNIQSLDIDTDTVDEGSSNLYFTTARARAAISVSGDLGYDSGTGIVSYTTPSEIASLGNHSTDDLAEGLTSLYFTSARARASMVGGTGISYNSSTGNISLAASGVTAQSYGSASEVPVITVDAYGRITSASTTSVAGVSTFTFTDATGVLNISTADGGSYDATIGLASFDTTDLAEGTNLYYTQARFDSALAAKSTTDLAEGTNLYYTDARAQAAISTDATLNYSAGEISMPDTGVTAGSYGSASQVPVIAIDAQGRITSATTTAVAGVSSTDYNTSTGVLTINTSDGGSFTEDLGVGTADSPSFVGLDISAAMASTPNYITMHATGTNAVGGGGGIIFDTSASSTDDSLYFASVEGRRSAADNGSSELIFRTALGAATPAIRMRITDTGNVEVNNSLSVGSSLSVTGTSSFNNSLSVGSSLSVTGTSSFNNNVSLATGTQIVGSDGNPLVQVSSDQGYFGSYSRSNLTLASANDPRYRDSAGTYYTIWHSGNDGSGSGLDADTLDGLHASSFLQSYTESDTLDSVTDRGNTTTNNITVNDINVNGNAVIEGDLTVNGTTTTIDATNLAISDNFVYLNDGNGSTTNVDLGWAGGYNDGTYAHAGIFRDASDGRFKAFDSYTPEPDAAVDIDTSHASFALADFQADTFYGALSGNASTASKWTTARTLSLTGDVTGSVSWDGSANASITTIVANDSHSHSNYLPLTGGTLSGLLGIRNTGTHTLQFNTQSDYSNDTNNINIWSSDASGSFKNGEGAHLVFEGRKQTRSMFFKVGDVTSAQHVFHYNGYVGFGIGDSTTPSEMLDVSGNIAVSGTVDGVDLAAFKTAYDSHTHSYLPLSGGSLTGALDFNTVTGRAITITADTGLDGADASIYLGNNPSQYGFDIKYEGTGSGNTNAFVITSTNQGSPKELIRANQDGIVNLPQLGANVAGNTIWHAGNDGSGSGLDADLLDGNHASAFALAGHAHSGTYLPIAGGTVTGFLANTGGAKLEIQNGSDGGTSNGIYMWTSDDSNWLQYMAQSGAGKAPDGGTACTSIDGRTAHHIRYRVNSNGTQGHLWENSADLCLMSLTGDTGKLYVRGDIYAGNSTSNKVWHAGNDGSGSGLDADLLDGQHASAFVKYTESTSAPSGTAGDEWYDTADGILYKYIESAWVQQSPAAGIGIYDVNGTKLN